MGIPQYLNIVTTVQQNAGFFFILLWLAYGLIKSCKFFVILFLTVVNFVGKEATEFHIADSGRKGIKK